MMNEDLYYIQDTRSYNGNAVVWWGIDGKGYTSNLSKAGKYPREVAKKICERETDRAWPCDYIDNNIEAKHTTVDAQYLSIDKSIHETLNPWNSKATL